MALKGIKVIEIVGLAPAPFCGMILSDFGANVIRVDRVIRGPETFEPLRRGKQSIALDLKHEEGKKIFRDLCKTADVVIEPFRPGVMEKLGLGPKSLSEINKRLVYARMSGFGQTGPLSKRAGHDINYLAISGILSVLGNSDPAVPSPPTNLLADFAGGGMTGALGICMALIERQRSGLGQTIDANLVEGTSYVSSSVWANRDPKMALSEVIWPNREQRGKNLLDGGAPFYQVYRTKDDKFMAVGALEPQFYANFLNGLGLDIQEFRQDDMSKWDQHKKSYEQIFATKTQKEWTDIFDPLDCCVTPVVDIDEAHLHEHNKERGSFLANNHPRPAPHLERTPGNTSTEGPRCGQHTQEILTSLGYSHEQVVKLLESQAIGVDDELGLQAKL
ncbi:Alpha-methylacyl-CoA racemase [Halotydeus destructor]|nr:Alpha-methylacyl-CoA racemase [Halotydeus destructor]